MNFKIGQIDIRIFELDLMNLKVRACVDFPIGNANVSLAGEFDSKAERQFYVSVGVDRKDESHAEESVK